MERSWIWKESNNGGKEVHPIRQQIPAFDRGIVESYPLLNVISHKTILLFWGMHLRTDRVLLSSSWSVANTTLWYQRLQKKGWSFFTTHLQSFNLSSVFFNSDYSVKYGRHIVIVNLLCREGVVVYQLEYLYWSKKIKSIFGGRGGQGNRNRLYWYFWSH